MCRTSFGTLNPMLKRAGFRIRYVNFGRHPDAAPSLDGYDGLVVLGGPMSAYDDHRLPHLAVEMKLIECAMQRNLPVLGICLGAQLVARTLGARVYANHIKEIGWYDVARPTMPNRTRCSTTSRIPKRSFNGMATPLTSPTARSIWPRHASA
jgi:GMP synthase (glutamine-hydrolysing)